MNRREWMGASAALVLGGLVERSEGQAVGPDAKQWETMVDKAIAFLRKSQQVDVQKGYGTWSLDRSPGCTGIVLTGLLKSGRVTAADPLCARALLYIERELINPEKGHIAGRTEPKPQLLNYVTSVNIMAFNAAGQQDKYEKVIKNAANFLKGLQWDETENKDPKSDFYGGAGYDSKSRPDLSNTQFFLDALIEAGVPKDDPALKKALVFVSRCQNLKGEHNDQPWAGKINDGSFIYSAAGGGVTKAEDGSGALTGYGSMTYAGIKSMIYCGVAKDDVRIQRAFEWIQKNYTTDANPGMPKVYAERGLYYYYHTMAKTLAVMGVDVVVDAQGKQHDWRAEITQALARRQQADGSWVNASDSWMEGDPNLVTGYALMALAYCKPKK